MFSDEMENPKLCLETLLKFILKCNKSLKYYAKK